MEFTAFCHLCRFEYEDPYHGIINEEQHFQKWFCILYIIGCAVWVAHLRVQSLVHVIHLITAARSGSFSLGLCAPQPSLWYGLSSH